MMRIIISTFLALIFNIGLAQSSQETIRINQLGYYPDAVKMAIVVGGTDGEPFHVITEDGLDTLYSGSLTNGDIWSRSGETVRRAEFTDLEQQGNYYINVPSVGNSYDFTIGSFVHDDLLKAVIKGFYFQRASTALTSEFAGQWARPAGHQDNVVQIHASVESPYYQAGDVLLGGSSKGWYDAGDYNKYIVNSGISTYSLLALFEQFPGYFKDFEINIPEKNNDLPDILDEIIWNLEWMLTMQDQFDGGVSHKLTSNNFSGTVMPHEDDLGRYFIYKSTTATLDFAAVMAVAARIFENYEDVKPGFAQECYDAAIDAWIWARKNPDKLYDQEDINDSFDPDIRTGAYGDWSAADEFDWAAAELYITTKADTFYTMTNLASADINVPGWQNVRGLPFISLSQNRKDLTTIGYNDTTNVKNKIINQANWIVDEYEDNPYRIAVNNEFYWGSNSNIANKGIMLMQAYYLTKNEDYLTAAISNLDYLMGKNALGYNMVTGFGDHSPMDPHHRISEADGIVDPVPGLLVGGPNGQQANNESCPPYPSTTYPAKRYLDNRCSFSTNEIAINWNAAISYLAGSIQAVKLGYHPNEWSAITSVSESMVNAPQITLYPNPASNNFSVTSSAMILEMAVYDMTGKKVNEVELYDREARNVSIDNLESGLYFIQIQTPEGEFTKKLIKQ